MYTPRKSVISTCQAVSSRVSRNAAWSRDSPASTWPAGWFSTSWLLACSRTSRNLPSCSTRVATVIRAVKLLILLPGWGNWSRMVPQGRQEDYRRLTIRRLYAGAAVPTDGGGVGGGAGGAAHVPAARATGRVPVRPASSHRF